MIKYVDKSIVFEEIPDKITLAFSISNCQNKCKGCHSGFLRKDIGNILNEETLVQNFNNDLKYCNCVLFLGEGNDLESLINLSKYIKENYKHIETAIYSGRDLVGDELFDNFDFVKVGSYQEDKGPLTKRTTNQRLYYHREDITNKFWDKIPI